MHRIFFPKLKLNNNLVVISWFKAFNIFLQILFFSKIQFVKIFVGPFCDLESAFSLKLFFNNIGCSNITYYTNLYYNVDFRSSFLLNNSLINLENLFFIILIGTNLRMELPLLNSRIRKSWINSNYSLVIYSFGLSLDYLTFPVLNINNNVFSLFQFFQNKHNLCLKIFKNKANYLNLLLINYPYFFIGLSILNRIDSNSFCFALQNYVNNFLLKLSTISVVSPFLGRLSSLEFNLNKKIKKSYKNTFIYLSNVFDHKFLNLNLLESDSNFIVFSGSFKDHFFFNSNLIFPIPIFTETVSTYLNIEGRLRGTQVAISLKNQLYNEYQIFRYLYVLSNLKYYNNYLIVNFKKLLSFFKNIINYNCIFFSNNNKFKNILLKYLGLSHLSLLSNYSIFILYNKYTSYKLINSPLYLTINNYYSTDFFSKNSKILSLCASKCLISSFSLNQNIII